MDLITIFANSSSQDIETSLKAFSINTVLIASLIIVTLIIISTRIVNKRKYKKFKKPLFLAIVITVAIPTLLMSGSSIYLNTISDSKGPVHWHTDIEFWVCGEEVELRDPISSWSNKIGTSSYHEHDDKRIHLEGVVIDSEVDAGLEKLMRVTGGSITKQSLTIPTEDSIFEDDLDGDKVSGNKETVQKFFGRDTDGRAVVSVSNGVDSCSEPGYAEVQTFVYTFNKADDTYSQRKLEDPSDYTMRDESIVPPGDCVIVEFDQVKDRTDKLCQQYGVKDVDKCVEFGVEKFNPKVCKIREVDTSGGLQ